MANKSKSMTRREKEQRAKIKKELQKEGLLPPDKPRLNRKKFAEESRMAFDQEISLMDPQDVFWFDMALTIVVSGTSVLPVTSEQIGVLKAMRIAVELKRWRQKMRGSGEPMTMERVLQVADPILKL